jgi:hypothetical protein
MTRKPVFIFSVLSFIGIAVPLFAAENTEQAQVTHTERVSLDPGATIRVNGSYGNVHVEGWDQREVEITSVKSMPFSYKLKEPDEAKKHLESVQIVTERKSATELLISTVLPARAGFFRPPLPRKTKCDVRIEYEIHAPRDTKLVIHHGTGGVFVEDMTEDIEATGGRGDILLMLPGTGLYTFDAKSKFGTVISAFDGDPHPNRYRLGERYTTTNSQPARRIYLRMGFGGITIKAVPVEAYAATTAK